VSNKNVLWVVMDIETEGSVPGQHSMLSLGAVALNAEYEEVGTWYGTFSPTSDTRPDPNTMDWWRTQPEAVFKAARDGARDPVIVIKEFVDWVESFDGVPYAVLGPTGFDWPFIYYYIGTFGHVEAQNGGGIVGNPFGFRTRDIRTLAAAYLGKEVSKDKWPKRWFSKTLPHTHHALDDARGLAFTFAAIQRDIAAMDRPKKHEK